MNAQDLAETAAEIVDRVLDGHTWKRGAAGGTKRQKAYAEIVAANV